MACRRRAPGEIGALLQRRGPTSETVTIAKLARENAQLRDELARAELVIACKKTGGAVGSPGARVEHRPLVTTLVQTHGAALGVARLGAALGVPRAAASRWRPPPVHTVRPRRVSSPSVQFLLVLTVGRAASPMSSSVTGTTPSKVAGGGSLVGAPTSGEVSHS